MADNERSILGRIFVPCLLLAVIAMVVQLSLQSYTHSQIDHQYQLLLGAVTKAQSLGIEETVSPKVEEFLGSSPKDLDEMMTLVGHVRGLVDHALDEKYEHRGAVYADELRDRTY